MFRKSTTAKDQGPVQEAKESLPASTGTEDQVKVQTVHEGAFIRELQIKEMDRPDRADAVQGILLRDAHLINGVPYDVALEIVQVGWAALLNGKRSSSIVSEIERFAPSLIPEEALGWARTALGMASSARTEARATSLGFDWYIWRTAKDGERVRESHRNMEGVLCRWSEPPDPERLIGGSPSEMGHHPGCDYQCRCVSIPILDTRDIVFPARVYYNGIIHDVDSVETFCRDFPWQLSKKGNEHEPTCLIGER